MASHSSSKAGLKVSGPNNLLFTRRPSRLLTMTDELNIEPDAQAIWDAWTQNHSVLKGRAPDLTMHRLEIIRLAIISYGLNSCIDAIVGCKKSEWHMGSNPSGKKYNSLELILRASTNPGRQAINQKRIQKFVKLANKKDDGDV